MCELPEGVLRAFRIVKYILQFSVFYSAGIDPSHHSYSDIGIENPAQYYGCELRIRSYDVRCIFLCLILPIWICGKKEIQFLTNGALVRCIFDMMLQIINADPLQISSLTSSININTRYVLK